ncbi:MAG: hypothetical protein WCB49_05895 [Gammaproteobacteria bacterium]
MKTTRIDGKQSASKTRLREGEHSIDRAQPSVIGDFKYLRWSVRPVGYAQPLKRRTQVPKRETDGRLRELARAKAAELLRSEGRDARWKPTSAITEYIDIVVRPHIETESRLSAATKVRYMLALKQLTGDCTTADHTHTASLSRLDIRTGSRYRTLEDCLKEIARLHGAESARQARTVLTGYVLRQLQHDELIDHNTLQGTRIDLKTGAAQREGAREGAVSIGRDNYLTAVDYLLSLDPAEGAVKPIRGRWTIDDVIAKRRNTIDLTLLQAGTGLRISEARQAWCGLFSDSAQNLRIDVAGKIAKGGIARVAYVLEPRIADRLRERLNRCAGPSELVVGSPFDPTKVWDLRNASKAVEALYLAMHDQLGIEAFATERSHVWRATLNTMLIGVVPEVMRSAQFGHTAEVNRKSYTDRALTPEMVAASTATFTK